MITRRKMIFGATALCTSAGLVGAGAYVWSGGKDARAGQKRFEIEKTEAEWKKILSAAQFAVLRKHATERAGTSPLLNEKREGLYHCAGCALPLYRSQDKYDSKTGWPSFTQAIDKAIGTQADNSLFMTRTEVHCRRCGGHLGHIFDDGPQPTGKRHCLNGLALKFVAA